MKICIISLFLALLISALEISCSQRKDIQNGIIESKSVDTLERIPYREDSAVSKSRSELFLKNLAFLIKLPNCIDSQNCSNVRFWVGDSHRKYVLTLKESNKGVECVIVEYTIEGSEKNYELVIYKRVNLKRDISFWKNVRDSLDFLDILNLKGTIVDSLPISGLTNMNLVQIEVENSKEYRYIELLEPSYYRMVDDQSNRIFCFLTFLTNKLGVQFYDPPKDLYQISDSKRRPKS